jgi:hypothetical protein
MLNYYLYKNRQKRIPSQRSRIIGAYMPGIAVMFLSCFKGTG